MTDTAGPFDGAPWSEAQWHRHAGMWAPSGAYGTPSTSTTTGDLPLSVSGLTVGLGAGRANVRGAGFERTGAAVMQAVSANTHASFSRRDRIVLRRNLATHTVTPVLLTGTPAGTPAAPTLTQSDTGSWDLPKFSFLVPPNSGTSITGIVDERGWINGSGTLEVPSIAVRDAHFPSPTRGNACTVNGNPHTYTGAAWKYENSGRWLATDGATTDSGGFFTFPHGLGTTPSSVNITPGPQASDLLDRVGDVRLHNQDASNIVVRFIRTDTSAYLGGSLISFHWSAKT